MKTLSGNRLSEKFLRECYARLSHQDVLIEVGKDPNGHWVGIPHWEKWIESFKVHFDGVLFSRFELFDGVRPHLKAIRVFIPTYVDYDKWPCFQEKFWVCNGVGFETIYPWEISTWVNSLQNVEERWLTLLRERQRNPRNARGELLLKTHDQNQRTLELKQTQDGSFTLFFKELEETYHSTQGAHVEAMWVFIERGFKFVLEQKKPETSKLKAKPLVIRLLEVGFGTGLNAFLTADNFLFQMDRNESYSVEYTGLEPYPLSFDWVSPLGYTKYWNADLNGFYQEIHQKPDIEINLDPQFRLKKSSKSLEAYQSTSLFDLIYYDAFAPNKQSEIWSEKNMEKCFELLDRGGVLVSYCAKGEFKRNLKKVGFEVESLPGPPGRREMVRALKP